MYLIITNHDGAVGFQKRIGRLIVQKFLFVLGILFAMVATEAKAGPFRRSRSSSYSRTTNSVSDIGGNNSTAQGVAEIQARRGFMGHCGGNSSYEGVGVGMSPQAALNNCCNNGKPVIDQGVAQGANGMWYACKRYR